MLLGKQDSFIDLTGLKKEIPLPEHVKALIEIDAISSKMLKKPEKAE